MPPAPAFFASDEEQTFFSVGLDDLTVARLMEICDEAKVPPALVIAAMVRDILEDDATAHGGPVIVRSDSNRDLH